MKRALVLTPPFLEPFRPPISGAIIAEVARLQGYDVTALDLSIVFYNQHGYKTFESIAQQYQGYIPKDNNSDKIVNEFINEHLPETFIQQFDLILISIFSKFEQEFTFQMLEHLRPITDKTIVIGGAGAKVHRHTYTDSISFGAELFNRKLIDYWIEGEGEYALAELLKGNTSYPGINGISPKQIDDIENLPLPNYEFYDIKDYQFLTPGRKEVFIYGSRGCVRNCTFCDVAHFWPTFRYRSGQSLAEEMIRNYEKFGITDFYFADSLFNGSLKAYRDFLTTITKYPQRVNWQWGGFAIIRNKKQHPQELYDMCKEAGTSHWVVGIEHAVDRIRFDMRKPVTNEDCEYHFEQSERSNIKNTVLLIPCWPDETKEEHLEYVDMFRKWQRYVASGAISACNITQSLMLFENTPLADERLFDWAISKDSLMTDVDTIRNFWINKDNLELDVKERLARVFRIYQSALKYKWPIVNAENRLYEIRNMAKTVAENPNLNSTKNLIDILDKRQ